jgi:hypothetical protein
MTANIVLDDGIDPASQVGIEAPLGTVIAYSNFDDTGILGWQWTLLDLATGSAAVLSDPNGASGTFTIDVEGGTWLLQLQTYTDAGRTALDDTDTNAARVLFLTEPTEPIPAAGETLEFDANRGWAAAINSWLRKVRTALRSDVAGQVAAVPSATAASADTLFVNDADDGDNPKSVTAQSIADLAGGGGIGVSIDEAVTSVDGATGHECGFLLMPDNDTHGSFIGRVVGTEPATGDRGFWEFSCEWKRNGAGVVSVVGNTNYRGIPAIDAGAAAWVGPTIGIFVGLRGAITVRGEAGKTIEWRTLGTGMVHLTPGP